MIALNSQKNQENAHSQMFGIGSDENAFLSGVSLMNQSMSLSDAWAVEYESTNQFSTLGEMLALLSSAPDEFARGAVFSKINALHSIAARNAHPMDADSTAVQKHRIAYTSCQQFLIYQGSWYQEYEGTLDFCSDASDFSDTMRDLENLMLSAPNAFCKGVMFGKMAALVEAQSILTRN